VEHKAVQQPAYRSRENVGVAYDNRFFCIKSSALYVPLQRNPKPVAYGLDTAFVIDESSSGNTEEIWPDKYGRVRVRFHWDREEKYACWLRVVQPWAGKMWGHQWIPRVTDEVMVSFLHGDPDCPIIMGSVYNKDNMPVFELPAHKTQAGIKTHSSKNGGSNDFNMLRFEDLKGSEEVYFQAQKDHNTLIKNDETRQVKNNRTTTIHVNDARTVETGNDTIDVQQGNRTITVDQGNISETASVGSITITASANSITINGATQITLQCGASTIKMTPANISINSPMVLINS
jgi:type VI secretion system secreted protein VgrG